MYNSKYKVNEIGKILTVNDISYVMLYDGRFFRFRDSEINPTITPLEPHETDKLALYFLEKKLEKLETENG